ncbi:hypothetical protein [Chryseobacterium chendengshani]|uniref:hypothetical protein n=1 Tax=Chryseobacterium sp. LJ756 TaxID=2864113 RepID=UPI001C642B0F|nr:hypothetical protein [Chryseobacterium sp. LJ756]MBW7676904.1 hypothetical protein [Chryseobacterium sp. LJ756]
MKKLFLSLIMINVYINTFAQVGIGTQTISPQKALHISGNSTVNAISGTIAQLVTPTIRIDGLNNVNQGISDKLRPVSATDNGDIVLSHAVVIPLIMIDPITLANSEKDYITVPITINQPSATSTDTVLRSFSFVLTSPSIVKFGATTSFQFYKASDGSVITDGANRLWGTRFRFSIAPTGVSTAADAFFGESLKAYENSVNSSSATGLLYANSEDMLSLPAGNYTMQIISSIETQSTQIPIRIINGSGNDNVSVVAYPIQ